MAKTKKITIEVEVPEGVSIGRERLERIARVFLFEIASQNLAKLLEPSDDEVEELAEAVEEALCKSLEEQGKL